MKKYYKIIFNKQNKKANLNRDIILRVHYKEVEPIQVTSGSKVEIIRDIEKAYVYDSVHPASKFVEAPFIKSLYGYKMKEIPETEVFIQML